MASPAIQVLVAVLIGLTPSVQTLPAADDLAVAFRREQVGVDWTRTAGKQAR